MGKVNPLPFIFLSAITIGVGLITGSPVSAGVTLLIGIVVIMVATIASQK